MCADAVTASDLAAAVPDATPRLVGNDVVVADLFHDSRDVVPGSGFIAIRGAISEGHDYAAAACAAGANLLIVDHEVPPACTQLVIDDTRRRMARLAATVHGNPATRMKMVGVTGTNGKTTVTHMVESIVNAAGGMPGVVGTVGAHVAGEVVPLARTTPEATDLQRLLREMADRGVDVVALEVSSHALVLGRADAILFDVAAFTNLSQDHLDFHGTMEEYFAAKAALFSAERARHSVIWVDDPAGRRLAGMTPLPVTTVGFGSAGTQHVGGDITSWGPDHTQLTMHLRAGTVAVRIPLGGRFNAANALLAAAVADQIGIDVASIVTGIEALPPVPGRFEQIPNDRGFAVVVDYAHTPDAVASAIAAAAEVTEGRVIAIAGAAGDRDPAKRVPMGAAAATADIAIITSDNPRSEDPAALVQHVVEGAGGLSNSVLAEVDRRAAIRRAIRLAAPSDMILILGKGHEPYQEFADVTIEFDDRRVAAEELAARSGDGHR